MQDQHLDSAQIAARFEQQGIRRTQKAIQRRRERLGVHAQVAESPVPKLGPPPTMHGDALLLFDIHCPCHDAVWINRVIDLALRWGIRKVGIGGDLVDFDTFTSFERNPAFDVEVELRSAENIISALESCFDEVVYSCGNHEVRLSRRTDWLLPVQDAVKLFVRSGKTTFTRSHWFILESGGQRFHVEHPGNYSGHATLVPKRLCSKYLCHVVAGHGHTWGIGRDVSDTWYGVDAGICADPERLAYAVERHNTRPAMQQGAVIVRGGEPILLSPTNIAVYEQMELAA